MNIKVGQFGRDCMRRCKKLGIRINYNCKNHFQNPLKNQLGSGSVYTLVSEAYDKRNNESRNS